ncbi:hypothetical protein ACIQUP_25480 [Streptomyces nigra]|uniref:hypothetical protein n=1 Tax=Streptomyces nigra TaxID=1827580 RepID=UPI00381A3AB4
MFDVLEAGGKELLDRPYRERRAMLEDLFARDVLGPRSSCAQLLRTGRPLSSGSIPRGEWSVLRASSSRGVSSGTFLAAVPGSRCETG